MVLGIFRTVRATWGTALLFMLAVAIYAAFNDGGLTGAAVLRAALTGGAIGGTLHMALVELPGWLARRNTGERTMRWCVASSDTTRRSRRRAQSTYARNC